MRPGRVEPDHWARHMAAECVNHSATKASQQKQSQVEQQ